jgi:uncharacterized protein (UPF0218 family)
MQDGAALEALGTAIHKTLLKAATHPELAAYDKKLARVLQRLAQVTHNCMPVATPIRHWQMHLPIWKLSVTPCWRGYGWSRRC